MPRGVIRPLPSQERLKEVFDYDPENGILVRRWRSDSPNRCNARWAGKPAGGTKTKHSYINVDGELLLTHRVIWKWVTGDDLFDDIDHRDLDPMNNRWDNLRIAGKSGNAMNRRRQANNTSGQKGVHWDKSKGKWAARIKLNGVVQWLGRFAIYEDACAAYRTKAAELFGEYYRAD